MKKRVDGLREAIEYVRQFADDKAIAFDYYQVRVSGHNLDCGTHEWGGDIDLPDTPFEGEFGLNVFDLSDFLGAVPRDAPLSVSREDGLLVIKCGRARRKFETYAKSDARRSLGVNGKWHSLPANFSETLATLGRQTFFDKPVLVSDGGLLFYRDSRISDMLVAEGMDLPDFKLTQRFVAMVSSFEPTVMAVDTNRVGFATMERRMFAPLTVSNSPPVAKLLERTRENISQAHTRLALDAKSLREAMKVLSAEKDAPPYITVEAQYGSGDIAMSRGRTECAVEGESSHTAVLKVSSAALKTALDAGMDTDGVIILLVTHTNEVVYVQKGNLTLLSSTQRKNG